jgi:hypothetical protein
VPADGATLLFAPQWERSAQVFDRKPSVRAIECVERAPEGGAERNHGAHRHHPHHPDYTRDRGVFEAMSNEDAWRRRRCRF